MKLGLTNLFKKVIVLCVFSGMLVSSIPSAHAANIPNWKSLYQSKIQQIDREYSQGKRSESGIYDTPFYSLLDLNFDGIPELYHALVSVSAGEYNFLRGSEEIYYIKNGRVEQGNIQAHETLGLMPAYVITDTAADRRWQMALYDTNEDEVKFITKDSWTGSEKNGLVIISQLRFDMETGMVAVTELSRGRYNRGEEPGYPAGCEFVGVGSTYSDSRRKDNDIWKWTAPYIVNDSEDAPVEVDSKKDEWKEAYRAFVLDKKYLKSGQKYNDSKNAKVTFALHDVSGDGIPELIAKNDIDTHYVYTYQNERVSYVGKIGERETRFLYASGYKYPGLYWEGGTAGYFPGYYCYIENGQIEEELVSEEKVEYYASSMNYIKTQVTKDDKLYQACKTADNKLDMYSVAKISSTGWSNFVTNSMEKDNTLFEDVNLNSWFYEAVKYVNDKGLMSGVSDTFFSTEEELTRAMFITVLYRMEGEPKTKDVHFKDVEKGSWYEKAVAWASEKKIASGVEKDLFAPNDNITREQLATILFRYADYKNMSTKNSDTAIKCFIDNCKVSEYAVEPMNWAIHNGLISGTDKNNLTPEGYATRAQAAVILYRFCENVKK